jgi:dephospho-CoA kinase
MIAEVEQRVRETLAGGGAGVIINAALLYQMGLDRLCRWIIYVRAAADTRLQRIMTGRGLSPERARARLAAQDQEPVGDGRVIFCDNDGSLDHLREWVDRTFAAFASPLVPPACSENPP